MYGGKDYSTAGFFVHVTWRYRWLHDSDRNFTHLGVGAGRRSGTRNRIRSRGAFELCGTWRR